MRVTLYGWCLAIWSTHLIASAFTVPINIRVHPSSSSSSCSQGRLLERQTSTSSSSSSCNNIAKHCQQRQRTTTRLNDISEWRDMMFDEIVLDDLDEESVNNAETISGPLREVCVLPFSYDDVILQGETKELRLYEERFIHLFDDCMENHAGMVAMGLLAQSGVIQSVPLCEIEAYNRMEGFGIFVTIRSVGRASLITLTEQEPYMKTICTEKIDKISPNLDLHNLLAANIENMMVTISSMEYEIKQAANKDNDNYSTTTLDNASSSSGNAKMKRRILKAQLEDQFYKDDDNEEEEDEEEDDDEEDEDDEDIADLDRSGRFRLAFKTAKATDQQGYINPLLAAKCERSLQDLTAISWAAFCTEEDRLDLAAYRIQALDCDDLFERLKLGSHMMKEKKESLQKLMKKNGIKFESRDDDSFPSFGSEEDTP
uniref:Lon N-terminal domain-containing protein n=1 Tax=Eucampia antarctica TaxID=49252 RepID=A0A7S2W004_9STRA|mmetsp:Transcript_14890/g.14359  ORF Transcript_14890/g.14359 Transcript_14890/m.14359 type:complete len:429 (+) Transcript_14890:49-1335(+)